MKFVVVTVCLLCILAVCISPVVDLPATSLRSYQAVVILLSVLMSAAFCLLLFMSTPAAFSWATSSSSFYRKKERRLDETVKFSSVLRC